MRRRRFLSATGATVCTVISGCNDTGSTEPNTTEDEYIDDEFIIYDDGHDPSFKIPYGSWKTWKFDLSGKAQLYLHLDSRPHNLDALVFNFGTGPNRIDQYEPGGEYDYLEEFSILDQSLAGGYREEHLQPGTYAIVVDNSQTGEAPPTRTNDGEAPVVSLVASVHNPG